MEEKVNMKFKITSKGIRRASDQKTENNVSELSVKHGLRDEATGVGNKHPRVNDLVKPSVLANSSKRKAEMSIDGQRGKKQKIDRRVKLQCSNILKELMSHPRGWIFSEPVDPVKLNIPDYFEVISEPMDLGSIKRKLEGNMYFSAEEFAADVRLTFSNAMSYNPPGHDVHIFAKELNGNFSRRWKPVESKLKHDNKNVKEASLVNVVRKNNQHMERTVEKNFQDTKPVGLNKGPMPAKLGTCRPLSSEEKNHQDSRSTGPNKVSLHLKLGSCTVMSREEKQKFKCELVQLSSRKLVNLRILFQKFGLTGLTTERIDSYVDSTDDETLRKFRGEIKALLHARDRKVEPATKAGISCPSSEKTIQKEHSSRSACALANHRQSVDSPAVQCAACGCLTCHCRLRNGSAQTSSSDLSSERSSGHDHSGDSELDYEVKHAPAFNRSSSGLDSDGPGVVINEENSENLSTPAASHEGWSSVNVPMSPSRALRAAMLKSRFADTIFRATHQPTLLHCDKSDPARMQQEKERLEREQRAERAKIEKEIKAAEAASRRIQEQRQREREAARMALQNMERSVEIDENIDTLRELETLCYGSPLGGVGFGFHRNLMERLGLYMKEDYLELDEEDTMLSGVEEGEILL